MSKYYLDILKYSLTYPRYYYKMFNVEVLSRYSLLGSYRVLMFSSRASVIGTQTLYRSRLKNLSTQWIETSPCMREPKAIPEHDDLIWSTKYSLRYPRYYYKMFNVQTPRIILDILTLSDILDTTTRCHMSKYYLRYPQILPQIS